MGIMNQTRFSPGGVWIGALLVSSLCGAFRVRAGEPSVPVNARAAVEAAIARMGPSLVRIHVVSVEYREGRELKMQAVRNGAIISKDRHLITHPPFAAHRPPLVCTLFDPA